MSGEAFQGAGMISTKALRWEQALSGTGTQREPVWWILLEFKEQREMRLER